MRRRSLLRTLGAGATAFGAGCVGGGGEVVINVQESVTVDARDCWMQRIPDVSDPGGAVSYILRSEGQPFDVYFFADRDEFDAYAAYVEGDDPDATPAGHPELSKTAVSASDSNDLYEVSTRDDGARTPLEATGPYFFVVDHTSYRMENRVEEFDDPLSVFVDLQVVRKRLAL